MFSKSEIKYLIVTILVMTIALAFNDGRDTFQLSLWLQNFVLVLLIVSFSFLVHQIAHKIVARKSGFKTEFTWWGMQGNPFKPKQRLKRNNKAFPRKIRFLGKEYTILSFPIGIVISLVLTVVSNGLIFFLAIGQYNLLLRKATRFGKRYVQVTEYEEAQIALAGPLSHIIIMTVFSFFNNLGNFDKIIFINAALALFYMIPFHKLDGTKIYFGSRLLYVSSLIFVVSMVILVYTLSTIPMLVISILATIIGASLYYYFTIYR